METEIHSRNGLFIASWIQHRKESHFSYVERYRGERDEEGGEMRTGSSTVQTDGTGNNVIMEEVRVP